MENDRELQYVNDNFLRVDNLQRPRANSDPGIFTLPEIIVQDFSGDSTGVKLSELEEDFFNLDAPMRPRSNTCPEDLFRQRLERPGTPPPIVGKAPVKHGRFNFNISPSKTCVSFAHHNLSKITEDEDTEQTMKPRKSKRFLKSDRRGINFDNQFNKDFELRLKLKDHEILLNSTSSS